MTDFNWNETIQYLTSVIYRVTGDHPIFARPDKSFYGRSNKCIAESYAYELEKMGYENVKVEEVIND